MALGSNDITAGGLTIDATELGRLDGKDAALVDVSDAVTTAITGTGTLTAGGTGSGFTLNFGTSTLSGSVTGSNIDESTLAGLTTSNFSSANISQWTNNSGYLATVDVSSNTNLSASDGITLTGDALSNSDKGSSQSIFKTIAVSGESNVVSDSNSDSLTFIAGTNITLTTDATNDTITINGSGGGTTYSAGNDLDLNSTTFDLESTLDFVDAINGLDSIDATTETTIETAIDALANLTTLTIGGDTVTDFVGAGLQLSGSTLTASLGTSVANAELDNDTLDLDKAADSLTFDANLTLVSSNSTNDFKLVLDNSSTGDVAELFEVTTSGTGATIGTALDLSDTDIATALAIGANDITVGGAIISSTEFALLDSGVAFSELTDSGTFTAGTVDINGGAIDGAVIGANSAAAGTFTTVTASGAVAANGGITFDAATDTVGAHTAAGTYNMNANTITNIGNAGTDFTATGGLTLADTLTTSANGIEFTESDSNPACAAGNYSVYADTSEGKLKKCQNGVASDLNAVPDVNSFTDATTEAWVDADTTNLWDGAAPNITPKSTNSEVLVMMSAFINTTSLTDVNLTAKIMRHTSAITCQTVGTNVWTVGTQTGFTAGQVTMAAAFVDAPGTTSNVQYTLCTDADSEAITGATMNTIQFTLFEVNDAADLAEVYPTNDESLQVGEVVSLDPQLNNGIVRAQKAYDKSAVGVISTKPALVIGGRDGEGTTGKPVALSGRVSVKVKGAVKKGDMLTSSSTPGAAMKATKAGPILGIAMTDFTPSNSEIGSVMLFVKTGYFNGSNLAEVLGTEVDASDSFAVLNHFVKQKEDTEAEAVDLSEVLADRVVAGMELITPRIVADEIFARSIKADRIEGLEFIESGISEQEARSRNQEARILSLESLFGSSSSVIASDSAPLTASLASGGAIPSGSKKESGIVSSQAPSSSTADRRNDELDLDSLQVNGLATVSGQLVADQVRVKNSLLVEAMLHVADTISSAQLIVNNVATFFGKAIFKDDVTFEGNIVVNKDMAGEAIIRKDTQEIEVRFEKEHASPPIVNASIAIDMVEDQETLTQFENAVLGGDIRYIITRKSSKGFTIKLNKNAPVDIPFSWTVIETQDKKQQEIEAPISIAPSL